MADPVAQLRADIRLLSQQFQAIVNTLAKVTCSFQQINSHDCKCKLRKNSNGKSENLLGTHIETVRSELSETSEFSEKTPDEVKLPSPGGVSRAKEPISFSLTKTNCVAKTLANNARPHSLAPTSPRPNHGTALAVEMGVGVTGISPLATPSVSPVPSPRACLIIAKDIKTKNINHHSHHTMTNTSSYTQPVSSRTLQPQSAEDVKRPQFRARRFSYPGRSNMPSSTTTSASTENKYKVHLRIDRQIRLNIGGKAFTTSLSTLTRETSMFTSMISGRFPASRDRDGCFFIDRDSTHFPYILNYLRDGAIHVDDLSLLQLKMLLQESDFYQIENLSQVIRRLIRQTVTRKKSEVTNEKEYKVKLNVAPGNLSPVFKRYTLNEGYDFESWMRVPRTDESPAHFHLVFSKKLSRGEIMLLDRLTSNF
ncbi:hypothetical protein AAMO2058_000262700 [Amorphochlora amoebiformis]